jgi:acetyltransferase
MEQTQLVVRVARPEDVEAVGRFLAGLSVATSYRRFLSPLHWVSPTMLRHLTSVDPARQVVLLAWAGDVVVGHAMAVCMSKSSTGGTVDLAIVVADDHQHTGVGHHLMGALLRVLVRHGVTRVHSDVLSDNRVVLDWLRRLVPDIHFVRTGPTVEAEGALAAA